MNDDILSDNEIREILAESLVEQGLDVNDVTDEMIAEFKIELTQIDDELTIEQYTESNLEREYETGQGDAPVYDHTSANEVMFNNERNASAYEGGTQNGRVSPKRSKRKRTRNTRAASQEVDTDTSYAQPTIDEPVIIGKNQDGLVLKIGVACVFFLVALFCGGLFLLNKLDKEKEKKQRQAKIESSSKEKDDAKRKRTRKPSKSLDATTSKTVAKVEVKQRPHLRISLDFESRKAPFVDATNNFRVKKKGEIISVDGRGGRFIRFKGGSLEFIPIKPMSWDKITICMWIYLDKYTGNNLFMGITRGFSIITHKRSFVIMTTKNNNNFFIGLRKHRKLKIKKWFHVAATLTNGDQATIYVNGTKVETKKISRWTSSENLSINYPIPDGWRSIFGAMDDVKVYDRILNGREIMDIYRKSKR